MNCRVILIGACKGGVGKSTVAANLARAYKRKGVSVAIIDADLDGSDIPRILRMDDENIKFSEDSKGDLLCPTDAFGIRVFSMAFQEENLTTALLWSDTTRFEALSQTLKIINWENTELIIVDLPAGTGIESRTMLKILGPSEAILITMPHKVSIQDVSKAYGMLLHYNIRILGIIENMSFFLCPHCGIPTDIFNTIDVKSVAEILEIEYLGSIPIETEIAKEMSIKHKVFDNLVKTIENTQSTMIKESKRMKIGEKLHGTHYV